MSGTTGISMVFSDMDGTFLTTDKRITSATWSALDRLAQLGIPFVPCTGRSASGIPQEVLRHPATTYAVSANGANIASVDETGERTTIRTISMRPEDVLAIYDLVQGTSAYMDIFVGDEVLAERAHYDRLDQYGVDEAHLAYMRRARTPVDTTLPQIVESGAEVIRVSFYWRDTADRDRMSRFLAENQQLIGVSSHPQDFEVTDAGATKGTAVSWLAEQLGHNISDVVAFGDSLNDASMLEAAGRGVAMGNSTSDALAVANAVTCSNDEDGVAAYLMGLL